MTTSTRLHGPELLAAVLLVGGSLQAGGCTRPSMEERPAPAADPGAKPEAPILTPSDPTALRAGEAPVPESLAGLVRAAAGVPDSPARTRSDLARLLLEGKEPEYRLYEVLPGESPPWDSSVVLTVGRMQSPKSSAEGGELFRWFRAETTGELGRMVVFEVNVGMDHRYPSVVTAKEVGLEPGEHAALVGLAAALKGFHLRERKGKLGFSVAGGGRAWYLLRVAHHGQILLDEERPCSWMSTPDPSLAVPDLLSGVFERIASERAPRNHGVEEADREWLKETFSGSVAAHPDSPLGFRTDLLDKAYGTLFQAMGIQNPHPERR